VYIEASWNYFGYIPKHTVATIGREASLANRPISVFNDVGHIHCMKLRDNVQTKLVGVDGDPGKRKNLFLIHTSSYEP
jgi:hypothetical protein